MAVKADDVIHPDQVVDDLFIHGALEHCRERVAEYQAKVTSVDADSRAEWLTTILDAQAAYNRHVAQAVASYYRDFLK